MVNGRSLDDLTYQAKLEWLDAFTAWLESSHAPRTPLIVAGDFNVAPDDRDVHDPSAWTGRIHVSEAERARIRALFDWGLVDLLRVHSEPGIHTWWDYGREPFTGVGVCASTSSWPPVLLPSYAARSVSIATNAAPPPERTNPATTPRSSSSFKSWDLTDKGQKTLASTTLIPHPRMYLIGARS